MTKGFYVTPSDYCAVVLCRAEKCLTISTSDIGPILRTCILISTISGGPLISGRRLLSYCCNKWSNRKVTFWAVWLANFFKFSRSSSLLLSLWTKSSSLSNMDWKTMLRSRKLSTRVGRLLHILLLWLKWSSKVCHFTVENAESEEASWKVAWWTEHFCLTCTFLECRIGIFLPIVLFLSWKISQN